MKCENGNKEPSIYFLDCCLYFFRLICIIIYTSHVAYVMYIQYVITRVAPTLYTASALLRAAAAAAPSSGVSPCEGTAFKSMHHTLLSQNKHVVTSNSIMISWAFFSLCFSAFVSGFS